MELPNWGLRLYIFFLTYSTVTPQTCDITDHSEQILYEIQCLYREYTCESITSSGMLVEYYHNHEENDCNYNYDYCYTMTVSNSQVQYLDDDTFTTTTTCPGAKLLWLILSGNNIEDLSENVFISPSSSWRIDELRHLSLNQNHLTNIEGRVFMFLPNLQVLDLSDNRLTSIGNVSYNLPSLKELYLNDNQITELSGKVFDKLIKVRALYLSKNKIRMLDGGIFGNMPELETLDLSNNNIEDLPIGVFKDLHVLKDLQLGTNRIAVLNFGIFSGLELLENLNLSTNEMSEVDDAIFFPLDRLTELDLSNNNLSSLNHPGLLSHLPELKTIYLDSLSASCSALIDVIKKFRKHGVNCIITSENKFNVSNVNGVSCQKYVDEAKKEDSGILENGSGILTSTDSKMSFFQSAGNTLGKIENQVNLYGSFIITVLLCILVLISLILIWMKRSQMKRSVKDIQLDLMQVDL